MLALARSEGQSIIIDGHIEVKVVKWSRSSVRLAIQAPREVRVDRDETWRKMNPGILTPLEVAEKERNERFAREGTPPRPPAPGTPVEATITAPVAGLFSAAPASGTAYVVIGTPVEPQTIVGTIQSADGAHTPVLAGLKGSVIRLLAQSGQTLAAGDPLILVKVSPAPAHPAP